MVDLYKKHQDEQSWLGSNLNQTAKRTNELALSGELSQSYYEEVLFPQVREIQELIREIKDEQHAIALKLIKL